MTDITCKVITGRNEETPNGHLLTFGPDYADGANKEWSKYTPTLQFNMTVLESVAEHFPVGSKFTVTFTPNDEV